MARSHRGGRARVISLRLTDSEFDGQWVVVHTDDPCIVRESAHPSFGPGGGGSRVRLVPTGDVEWDANDVPAEIWVPVDRLAEWNEHYAQLENPGG